MEPTAVESLASQLEATDESFVEFLRRDSMSLGVYRLEAGATDTQDPHDEDEAYYVVSGTAKIQIGDDAYPVEAGDVVYVDRGVEHAFFDIETDLVTLVFFAPPYSG